MLNKPKVSPNLKLPKFSLGFTLMEMLLVASLVSIVSLAIFNAMSNGLKIWEKSREAFIDEDVAIFIDKITQDLHNCLRFSYLEFEGKSERLKIPTIVYALPDRRSNFNQAEFLNQIGVVEYYFDPVKQSVYERQAIYGQALKKQFGPERVLIHSVQSLKFKYVYGDSEGNWQERQEISSIPLAVEVDLDLKERGSIKRISRHINIPVGTY